MRAKRLARGALPLRGRFGCGRLLDLLLGRRGRRSRPGADPPDLPRSAGLMFALTSLSYVEGGAMLRERGGSATFARHAFNELISFIAGWAILIDYLIVIAAAAITVSHYLTPISGQLRRRRRGAGGGDRGDQPGGDRSTWQTSPVATVRSDSWCWRWPSSALQLLVIIVGPDRRPSSGPAHRPAPPVQRRRASRTSSTRW